MAIDAPSLLRRTFPDVVRTYDARDAIAYAIAIGLGRDRGGPERRYVDASCLVPFPSMAASLGTPGFWMRDPSAGIDAARALHVGHKVTLHASLPAAATIVARSRVTGIADKGPGRGALVAVRRKILDRATSTPLATVDALTLCCGDGGCGDAGEAPQVPPPVPDRAPDAVHEVATRAETAALFALGGDDNPIHLDMEAARRAGYDRPILHGVCSLGIATSAVVAALAGGDASRLAEVEARFTGVAFPGETMRTEVWREGDAIAFRTWSAERGQRVLDAGRARLHTGTALLSTDGSISTP
ncbi:MAG: MaoC/PaaZ C-terminal domain-containing protein [Burkholderiales bacterium]